MALRFLRTLSVLGVVGALAGTLAVQPVAMAVNKLDADITPQVLHVVGSEENSSDVQSILTMVKDLVAASNAHDLEGVLTHYSPRFISGDNLTLEQVRKLIEETWQVYPDIQYNTQTLEIRVNGDWATVESIDTAKATAKADTVVSASNGSLDSRSRGLLFLHRIGKTWEILSDHTLYENATIQYGEAQNLKMSLSTPDQVFSGEPYSAKLDVQMDPGTFAIASITKDPLVYPQLKPEDKFRSISPDKTDLVRVFKANDTNNNEVVTATVGLTQFGQDDQDHPVIQLNGVATIVKRVNVLPKTKYQEETVKDKLINYSADGSIDLRTQSVQKPGDTSEPEPAPGLIPGDEDEPSSPDEGMPPAMTPAPEGE